MSSSSTEEGPDLPQISFRTTSTDPSASYHLIYFITGNPGLISYYTTFLTELHKLLSDPRSKANNDIYHIYGQSLAGFEDPSNISKLSSPRKTPYGLEEQITISHQALTSLRIPDGPRQGQPYASIIIIGHSVGSYILLELLTRLRKSSAPVNITGGILLFPTVTHIAKSKSGHRISKLFKIHEFPKRGSKLATSLFKLAPRKVVRWLVEFIAGLPKEAAEVTTSFLTSKMGIWQALHMARDEMQTITEDKWDADIWGVEHEEPDRKYNIPKLIFYFARKDHWVADHTRDALISARARGEGEEQSAKPIMLVDDGRIDHGFCIRHSERMAEKVRVWISHIVEDRLLQPTIRI